MKLFKIKFNDNYFNNYDEGVVSFESLTTENEAGEIVTIPRLEFSPISPFSDEVLVGIVKEFKFDAWVKRHTVSVEKINDATNMVWQQPIRPYGI